MPQTRIPHRGECNVANLLLYQSASAPETRDTCREVELGSQGHSHGSRAHHSWAVLFVMSPERVVCVVASRGTRYFAAASALNTAKLLPSGSTNIANHPMPGTAVLPLVIVAPSDLARSTESSIESTIE